jgi:ADP-ribose pyrophosphatase
MDDPRSPWRVVSSTYPISTPFLRLRSDVIELPGGSIIEDYYVRETRGFVVVFALTPDHDVVLVRQYKHGAGQYLVELPAGAIDEGESPRDCAARELAEETGYTGDPPELVRTFLADPTNSNGVLHLFLVRDAVVTMSQELDVTEDITVETASFEGLRAKIHDGTIRTGTHVACIYTLLDFLTNNAQ